jgi:hypothetical protein
MQHSDSGTSVTAIITTTRGTIVSDSTVIPASASRETVNASKLLLTLTFGILHVADAVVTGAFVNKHGLDMEANPLMHYIIANYGFGGMFMFKFVTLALWVCVAQKAHWGIHAALNVIMFIVVCMGIIVARS